ncbi:isocitrate lyase/PEP mutase family protein [Oryzifoliimicrobium ureilyticus]|uniref:isocitrate lyase/PEP mutase family protein n=1 Tax=Oryzifoliimicrobium ureilyticus TaxID=3113724 RepID=UPI0030762686
MADPALKIALANGEFILAPGVYDLISALIADQMKFKALYITGYGTIASYLGIPDAGIATYRDMLERVAQIVKMTRTPVIADADTGYGGLLNVRHTVRGYEEAGVTAIQIEDQEFPKKCGHTPNRRVIPMEDMVRKIAVAVDSRKSDDFLVIARTDARTGLGLHEAIRRGRAYAEAGADIIFVESPESADEVSQIAAEIDRPLLANMVNGGRTPLVEAKKLASLGYRVAIYPALGFLAHGHAVRHAYQDLKDNGVTTDAVQLYPFKDFNSLLGFEDIWSFEQKFSEQ